MRKRLFLATSLTLLLVSALITPGTAAAQRQPIRLAYLGDSLTMGLHASATDQMYREVLARRILDLHGGSVVSTVIQDPFGLTDDALRRSGPVVESRPDIIILEIGNHEAFTSSDQVDLFPARYEELLDRLQGTGAVLIAGTVAWLNYPEDSDDFRRALRVNQMIRDICARRGITVADLWSPTVFRYDLFSRPGDPSVIDPFDGDDLHPNDAGHMAL
ncbi:MAG: SGNH/GDSL hydrolase family protein, partial [Dehalococcoidia bacterium]